MSFDPHKLLKEQEASKRKESWLLTKIHQFNQAHNRLKHTVHTAWRYPLPPWGRTVMGFVYFSIPVIIGYGISNYAISISESTVKERFENKDTNRVQGLGDRIVVPEGGSSDQSPTTLRTKKVGAGGWGGGVNLATSDQKTQEINKVNLERFLRKQRRLRERRERDEARQHIAKDDAINSSGAETKE